jgi:Rad3-related DNA helicase
MLESPTGTGKTISLLSACIAFMKHHREVQEKLPIYKRESPISLIYCTRTHSQIKQVVTEIRNILPYDVNTQVLASKRELCINE